MSRKQGHHQRPDSPQEGPQDHQRPAPGGPSQGPAADQQQPAYGPAENLSPTAPPSGGGEEALRAQLSALQAERDDLLGRLQRVSADYLNYQKRIQRESSQAREYANEALLKALLGVLDDMERAFQAGRDNHPPDDPLLTGLQLVYDKALEVLGQFGLSAVQAEGKPFDPECQQAVAQEPSADVPPLTVLRELQKGYRLKARTIRPATVVVSQRPAQEAAEE